MAADFKPKYYVELEGNKRKITAELPEPYRSKVMAIPEKRKVVESPHIIGNSIRKIEFEYIFNDTTMKSVVRFEVHKFVKDCDMLELLIFLAAEQIKGDK